MVLATIGFSRNREHTNWNQTAVMWSNELEPLPFGKSHVRQPVENEDVARQVLGAGIVGFAYSLAWSVLTTQNLMSEFGRYQSVTWHPHRWAIGPGRHVARIYMNNAWCLTGMWVSFALFDGLAARLRGQEDPINAAIGGLGAGLWLGSLRGVYMGYVSFCVYGGMYLSLKRWGVDEDICPKRKFDENAFCWGLWSAGPDGHRGRWYFL